MSFLSGWQEMSRLKVVVLAGGVGGAKLVDGLAQVIEKENLSVVVNVGDDFEYLGLYISPDIDTVFYTLAGLANPITGWGRDNETWEVLNEIRSYNGADWFAIGDKDLALHIVRTAHLKNGLNLSAITDKFCKLKNIRVKIFPATNDRVSTIIQTEEMGSLGFQEYFVKNKCLPKVKSITFSGAQIALPAPGVLEAINRSDCVVIAPSNPWLSIDPILSIPGIKDSIYNKFTCCVSPIISGKAVKGPAAKIFQEMGFEPSAKAVALHYRDLLDVFVYDHSDENYEDDFQQWGIMPYRTDVMMPDQPNRVRLAREVLNVISTLKDKSL